MTYMFRSVTLILLSLLLTVAAFSQKPDDEVIKVDSSIVLVNATVTDATGRSVSRLTQKQFRIFEDGIEQPISSFTSQSTPFAAVILLDISGSMEERVSMARSAAIRFLGGLRSEDVTAIYSFDSTVKQVQEFSNSRDIYEGVFDLKAHGMTVLNDAIFKAAVVLSKRPEKRRAIIVLSDGADTMSGKSQDAALKAAIAASATIYTVDMASTEDHTPGRAQSQSALKYYSSKSGGTFVATPGGPAMRQAFKEIVEELGSQYTLSYEPSNTKKDGKFRSIEIKVAQPNLTIRTRKGYNAPKSK